MFLVDKYYNDPEYINHYDTQINQIVENFDSHQKLYNMINKNISNNEFNDIIKKLNNEKFRYSNFQHLIVYGESGCGKETFVNKILEKIFGPVGIELKDVEHIITGYSGTKTKIMIKQSKNHMVIEPNSNGFDKYLIQDVIQNYAKSELLSIIKNGKLFKIIIINKIDNLSYYAQTALRRTIEKYSGICKFILISDQLSKIIEPLISRCLLIRVSLPTRKDMLGVLLQIINKENIEISSTKIGEIINKADNRINNMICLLELQKYNIEYDNNWNGLIDDIVVLILNTSIKDNKQLYKNIIDIRQKFYILFITNISTHVIIRKIMNKLLNNDEFINELELKYNIIDITSIYEQRLNNGTRHIIHIEAYVIKLINLFNYNNTKSIIDNI